MGIVNAGAGLVLRRRAPARRSTRRSRTRCALVADGADLIDVGGESGSPTPPVTAPEVEIARVVPLVERLAAEGVAVSVDTWKPAVARAAARRGRGDDQRRQRPARPRRSPRRARATGAALVVMHTRAAPKQERFADYGGDVVGDVVAFLARALRRRARAPACADEQLVARSRARLRQDAGARPSRCCARSTALRGARAPAPARRLAQVLRRRDHRPPARASASPARWPRSAGRRTPGAAIVRVHDVAADGRLPAVRRVLRARPRCPCSTPRTRR